MVELASEFTSLGRRNQIECEFALYLFSDLFPMRLTLSFSQLYVYCIHFPRIHSTHLLSFPVCSLVPSNTRSRKATYESYISRHINSLLFIPTHHSYHTLLVLLKLTLRLPVMSQLRDENDLPPYITTNTGSSPSVGGPLTWNFARFAFQCVLVNTSFYCINVFPCSSFLDFPLLYRSLIKSSMVSGSVDRDSLVRFTSAVYDF